MEEDMAEFEDDYGLADPAAMKAPRKSRRRHKVPLSLRAMLSHFFSLLLNRDALLSAISNRLRR